MGECLQSGLSATGHTQHTLPTSRAGRCGNRQLAIRSHRWRCWKLRRGRGYDSSVVNGNDGRAVRYDVRRVRFRRAGTDQSTGAAHATHAINGSVCCVQSVRSGSGGRRRRRADVVVARVCDRQSGEVSNEFEWVGGDVGERRRRPSGFSRQCSDCGCAEVDRTLNFSLVTSVLSRIRVLESLYLLVVCYLDYTHFLNDDRIVTSWRMQHRTSIHLALHCCLSRL